jgi:endonuclease-8
MPEGPEIRRAVDRLRSVLVRRKAQGVFFAFEHLKPYETKLTGRRIRAVEARGKAVLVRFAGDWVVFSHNQLYGRWFVERAGRVPKTGRSLRFAIHTRERSALLYSASDIDVLRDGEVGSHPYLARLGPDPLSPVVTVSDIRQRAGQERFRRRSFASLLLDQGFLAGIGNYLRSEILFFAGIHPRCRPADCSRRELSSLASAALAIPRRAYETGGVTNEPARVEELKAEGLAFREYRHAVFGRDEQRCWRCGAGVLRENLSGRRGYYCPGCQPLG